MPRQARLDAPGTLHHVIIRGIEKRKIFDDKYDRKNFITRLGDLASDTKTEIYAWSLMSNHAHILLRSGAPGLSKYMRRLLSGYAITYNLRHKRHGHLFQNRYKSIVCEEDAYFQELVRYIHLNPLRAKIVEGLSSLDRYPWCGHSVVMGRRKHEWQNVNYVLSWFDSKKRQARKAYREYVKKGLSYGKRPELVGGGLIRSLGGWSAVMSLRRSNEKVLSDERILGSGEFVEKLIEEADERMKYKYSGDTQRKLAVKLIREVSEKEGINLKEMQSGSRRGKIPKIRSDLVYQLITEYGATLAETGRQLGVSTSAISKILKRRGNSLSI
ncbi:MAG: transposase [Desulfobacteraceae bacterium]|nr:transposase [Desulfobacteraceae bacterium]